MSAVAQQLPRSRVLVVDDDPEIVTFLATLLELEGIESQVATSAAAALSLLDRGLPSLRPRGFLRRTSLCPFCWRARP